MLGRISAFSRPDAARYNAGSSNPKEMGMERALASRFQRWFEYERDAHAKVLRSLETVPADRRSGPEFQRAVSILAHVAGARKVWLVRLGLLEGQASPAPKDVTLGEVAEALEVVHARWDEYLGRVTDEELGREFEYQSLDAGR